MTEFNLEITKEDRRKIADIFQNLLGSNRRADNVRKDAEVMNISTAAAQKLRYGPKSARKVKKRRKQSPKIIQNSSTSLNFDGVAMGESSSSEINNQCTSTNSEEEDFSIESHRAEVDNQCTSTNFEEDVLMDSHRVEVDNQCTSTNSEEDNV